MTVAKLQVSSVPVHFFTLFKLAVIKTFVPNSVPHPIQLKYIFTCQNPHYNNGYCSFSSLIQTKEDRYSYFQFLCVAN